MLSAESLKQIDTELAKYPADRHRSAIMGALRIAQTEKGWLAPETIEFVADYIGIHPGLMHRYDKVLKELQVSAVDYTNIKIVSSPD